MLVTLSVTDQVIVILDMETLQGHEESNAFPLTQFLLLFLRKVYQVVHYNLQKIIFKLSNRKIS